MKKFLTTTLILILVAITILSGVLIIRDVVSANSNIETPVDPGGETPVEPGGEDPTGPGDEDPDESKPEPEPQIDVWDGSTDTSWYDASKSEFILTTPEQLAGIDVLLNSRNIFFGKTIKLGADIYLNDETTNNNWTPLGLNANYTFHGDFDGQNHTIYGMTINLETPVGGAAFFRSIRGEFRNLKFENVEITNVTGNSNENGTAVLAGQANNTIENIEIKNAVINASLASGLVGSITGSYFDISDIKMTNVVLNGDVVTGIYGWTGGGMVPNINNCNLDISFNATTKFAGLGFYQNSARANLDNVNLNLNGSTKKFAALFDDWNQVYNHNEIVLKNSKISGSVTAEESLNLATISTAAENCELTLKINGNLVVDTPDVVLDPEILEGVYIYGEIEPLESHLEMYGCYINTYVVVINNKNVYFMGGEYNELDNSLKCVESYELAMLECEIVSIINGNVAVIYGGHPNPMFFKFNDENQLTYKNQVLTKVENYSFV